MLNHFLILLIIEKDHSHEDELTGILSAICNKL